MNTLHGDEICLRKVFEMIPETFLTPVIIYQLLPCLPISPCNSELEECPEFLSRGTFIAGAKNGRVVVGKHFVILCLDTNIQLMEIWIKEVILYHCYLIGPDEIRFLRDIHG